MNFNLEKSIEILQNTPKVLVNLLDGLSKEWIGTNEGHNTWSPYDIVGHLIVGEKTDWIVRIRIILSSEENKLFEPFDRFAQKKEDPQKDIYILLDEFNQLRTKNIIELQSLLLKKNHLKLTGMHPSLGKVSLKQLLASWVVHDLGHIAQIARVLAKQYQKEVGPWSDYLGILEK